MSLSRDWLKTAAASIRDTLGLSPTAIPTLQVVDDTFTKYRDTMESRIAPVYGIRITRALGS